MSDKTPTIICYNCEREIDVSDLDEGAIIKCKKCYTTLIVSSYFKELRKNLSRKGNRWGIIGMIIGLFPMIVIMGIATIKPLLFSSLYIIISLIMIYSMYYFRKIAADLLVGILFAEIGIYTNLSKIVLINYANSKYITQTPDLSFQVYLFLIMGTFFIIFGLRRRKSFDLR